MTVSEVGSVMLIDDNLTDRFIHKKLLAIHEFTSEIIECESAREGLEFFKANKESKDQLPDIILLDVLMPEMNGFDFLIHLEGMEDELAKKPIIFMLSSTDDESDLRKARSVRMVNKMLRKPFSPEALISAISEL